MNFKILSFLCISCFIYISAHGQAGAHVYFGVMNASFENQNLTPDGFIHPGYRLGIDGRLLEGKMYFMGGVSYSKYSLPAKSHRFDDILDADPAIVEWKYRFGLGFTLLKLPAITLRAKTLIALHDLQNHDSYDLPDSLGSFNRYFGAADIGLGVDLVFLTVDVEYEHGIGNAILNTQDTKMNVWTLSAGFFF